MSRHTPAGTLDLLTDAIRRLKSITAPGLLEQTICIGLVESFGFDAAAISRIDGGTLTSTACAGATVTNRPARLPLAACSIERAAVRSRRTTAADDHDEGATDRFAQLLGTSRYTVTPLTVESQTVGMIHAAQRHSTSFEPDAVELLETHARAFTWISERNLLIDRMNRQRLAMAAAARRLAEEAEKLTNTGIVLDIDDPTEHLPAPTTSRASHFDRMLTAREREVLELMVTGASNAEIARELVVGTETVKSHVKSILRKTGAINRAEAITLYVSGS
ncbi:LuxR C-terminal-related transcriptional regulator [Nocardia higoensis]|uniref:LuxR C-terminal-related transcriptional regulator n=1 Tax=Nocardia higoensis TaxID=228599 RepID=UPI000306DC0D|nr:LuxR C-terminal-related transcriptional regulator [Nocardia higoensis]